MTNRTLKRILCPCHQHSKQSLQIAGDKLKDYSKDMKKKSLEVSSQDVTTGSLARDTVRLEVTNS